MQEAKGLVRIYARRKMQEDTNLQRLSAAACVPGMSLCHRHAAELVGGEEECCNTCIMHHEQKRRAFSKAGNHEYGVRTVDKPPQEYAPAERSKALRTCKVCQKLPQCVECHRHFPHELLVEGLCIVRSNASWQAYSDMPSMQRKV